jgi:hypothetical protein
VAHIDLSGQVKYHLGVGVGEQANEVGADDVGLRELEPVMPLSLGDVLGSARAEIVDSDDGVSVCK